MHRAPLLLLLTLAPMTARAQEAPPPDIVRMSDGSIFRGTLVEFVPGERCVIELVTGERRTLDASLVQYAGPSGEQSAATPTRELQPDPADVNEPAPPEEPRAPSSPAPPPPTSDHNVTFHSDDSDVEVHLVRATASVGEYRINDYRLLCTAPCGVALRPGQYRFGLSEGNGRIHEAEASFPVDGSPLHLDVHYESREPVRIAGGLMMVLGPVLGAGLVFLGYLFGESTWSSGRRSGSTTPNLGLVLTGTVLGGVGLFGGMPVALTIGDVAHVQASPAR